MSSVSSSRAAAAAAGRTSTAASPKGKAAVAGLSPDSSSVSASSSDIGRSRRPASSMDATAEEQRDSKKRKKNDVKEDKEDVVHTLDNFAAVGGLTELHSHIMGMGSADFWVPRVMTVYLPRVASFTGVNSEDSRTYSDKEKAWEIAFRGVLASVYGAIRTVKQLGSLTVFNAVKNAIENALATVALQDLSVTLDADLVKNLNSLETEAERLRYVVDCFTDDVVYSLDDLRTLCGIGNSTDDNALYRLNGYFGPSWYKEYVVFNALDRKLRCVKGICNNDLAKLMKEGDLKDSVKILVRNWFEFLGHDGKAPQQFDIAHIFRGNFTPRFYPQRFLAKDRIVQQRPEVLSILFNSVLSRYAKAGVNVVELSLSFGDANNMTILRKLDESTFYTPIWDALSLAPAPKVSRPKRTLQLQQSAPSAASTGGDSSFASTESLNALNHGNMAPSEDASIMGEPSHPGGTIDGEEASESKPDADVADALVDNSIIGSGEATQIQTLHPDATSPVPTLITRPAILQNKYWSSNNKLYQLDDADDKSFKPTWRGDFGLYNEKPENQKVGFLMAVNRTGLQRFPRWTADKQEIGFFSVKKSADWLAELVQDAPQGWTPERIADELCKPASLKKMFRKAILKADSMLRILQSGGKDSEKALTRYFTSGMFIGFDLVGDESGFPCNPLAHPSFIKIVKWYRDNGRPNFGIRIHAGESVPYVSSDAAVTSTITKAYEAHMFVLMKSIKSIHDAIHETSTNAKKQKAPGVRIGHGVEFLRDHNGEHNYQDTLDAFRTFCRDNKIVSELNPTSNHMLLIGNKRTLARFFELNLPVVLCTDDDGIWSIRKCSAHYSHISVAHEYCAAIEAGEIDSSDKLREMLRLARECSFGIGGIVPA